MINYLKELPLPQDQLPEKLQSMLSSVNLESELAVKITELYRADKNMEEGYMNMFTMPENKLGSIKLMDYHGSNPTIEYGDYYCDQKGDLAELSSSKKDYDYLVASWSDGERFNYNLTEKVWITLGLSPRGIGDDEQKTYYDDRSNNLTQVVEGKIFYESKKLDEPCKVSWTMRNEYLRKYLWMRGHIGIRNFFYQSIIKDSEEVQEWMRNDDHRREEPDNGWYKLDIRKYDDGWLLQIWATVVVALPEKCPEPDPKDLIWPDTGSIKGKNISNLLCNLILKDSVLKKYEENPKYDTTPIITEDDIFLCSPSYPNVWSFQKFRRIGRNFIITPLYDLYSNAIPPAEISHVHKYAVSRNQFDSFDNTQEHIVQKRKRLADTLLKLDNLLHTLALHVVDPDPSDLKPIEISPTEHRFSLLARTVLLDIRENEFADKCKILYEFINEKISAALLQKLLISSGVSKEDLQKLGKFKLLEHLKNILDAQKESNVTWKHISNSCDLKEQNSTLTPLFMLNDCRQVDAHAKSPHLCALALKALGFKTAKLHDGYGLAFDFIFDRVIESIDSVNKRILESV